MTERAKEAVALNAKYQVVEGEWLTRDGRRVTGPPETWMLYKVEFEDGSKLVLNRGDQEALAQLDFQFRWLGVDEE